MAFKTHDPSISGYVSIDLKHLGEGMSSYLEIYYNFLTEFKLLRFLDDGNVCIACSTVIYNILDDFQEKINGLG